MIHINNLHKRFGDSHVLRGISCDIKPQEVVCIIGPSGSGKSTFLRCMNALETVSEGEVVVNGFAAHDRTTDLNKMRESVGMVFQRFNLFPHMTVLENLIMAPMNLRNMPRQQAVDLKRQPALPIGRGSGRRRFAQRVAKALDTTCRNRPHPKFRALLADDRAETARQRQRRYRARERRKGRRV